MKVLLSIKPEYANSILDGSKHFEFRKSIFKREDIEKVVIYATKPVGKVVGEFDIDGVLSLEPSELWEETKHHAGISLSFFESYFTGRDKGFAIKVKNPVRYREPFDLNQVVSNGAAPQSYRYL
ncbi:ASCH domain-containing protein [Vreelandella neptunia]|uniref:ASCH domain-containing protein n=1 Tax=Vreelandella neptunia TaxID=115551 RepID=A0ABS9S101_9GAMM|nr:ASCH domain-containing protein [Halomonas neptunia]MCH4809788.1 ASCH domain-containing protein [Halomonas neptunia]